MASAIKPISFFSLAIALLISSFNAISDPEPSPWPHQFHSLIFINNTGGVLQAVDLWYDWPNARNLNVVQNQLGKRHYEIEWGNGTSFYYTLDSDRQCEVREYPVGILRPNWLENATYLGRKTVDGFLCNVWEKVQFIWYYEDVVTKRPVYWIFFTGMIAHVMTFEVGAVLEDEHWQAPAYCFEGKNEDQIGSVVDDVGSSLGLKMMNSF